MIPRHRLATFACMLVAFLAGCSRPVERRDTWPMGFILPIDAGFTHSGGLRPNGEGSLFFLRGDEPDEPRLVVRKRHLRLSLEDVFEEEALVGSGPLVLEQEEAFATRAVNATGLGMRQIVQPVPLRDSTLVLLYDVRVFVVGNFSFAFVWQQLPGDSVLLGRYEEWMAHLRFLPEAGQLPENPSGGDSLIREDGYPEAPSPPGSAGEP